MTKETQRSHVWTNWRHHGYLWDDGRITDGSTSDADLPIHGLREGCDYLDGE